MVDDGIGVSFTSDGAALGIGVATRRIRSGQLITVDGDAGTVTPLDEVAEWSHPTPTPSLRRVQRLEQIATR